MTALIPEYGHALAALTILCIAVLIQSLLTAPLAFTGKGGQSPGKITGSPEQFSWRVLRTYMNSTENLAAFGVIVILAIIAGVSPKWVNLLASIHVGFRLLFWAVYYSKLGIKTPGPRTLCYVAAMLANLILAVMTLMAIL